MGSGKNGTFDKTPDLQQWAILTVNNPTNAAASTQECGKIENKKHNYSSHYGSFITGWWKFFKCETFTMLLQPIEGFGTWDGKKAFGELPRNSDYEGPIAVLTRATIHLNKLGSFWKNVDGVARLMQTAPGFVTSLGIGEVPWIKQATFSVWQSKAGMKDFAYRMKEHATVIRKTHQENWYKEDMFTRFKIINAWGNIKGKNPLSALL